MNEKSNKANLSPPVIKEADPKREEKSENLEAKVQSIELEANDLDIFEALNKLPKVPTDSVLRTKNCEEIEEKLLKLKFFNKTWLPTKSSDLQHDDDKTSTEVDDTVDESKEAIAEHVEVEPFFSSLDDQQDFNNWYEKKVEESKPPKKKAKKPQAKCEPCVLPNQALQNSFTTKAIVETCVEPILSSKPVTKKVTMETGGENILSPQPVTDKEPMLQVVNLNTVIVIFFTILSFLHKSNHRIFKSQSEPSCKPVLPMFSMYKPSPALPPSSANPGLLPAPDEVFWPCSTTGHRGDYCDTSWAAVPSSSTVMGRGTRSTNSNQEISYELIKL